MNDAREWAKDLLADAEFGHRTRQDRAALMCERAMQNPAGQLTRVFEDEAELQAAYNFVESSLPPQRIVDAIRGATFRATEDGFLYVVVDGTSLQLVDRKGTKGFGSVGRRSIPTQGVKVVDVLGVSSSGVPVGLLEMEFWARGPQAQESRSVRRREGDTEIRYWVDVVERSIEHTKAAGIRPWVVIDSEGDCARILRAASQDGADFTIRACQFERLCVGTGDRKLREVMERMRVAGHHFVDVPKTAKRRARLAKLDLRYGQVVLNLPDYQSDSREPFVVNVVWARERNGSADEDRLDWMLLTSRPIHSHLDAIAVIESYCLRWRVEEFHRTWKRGRCNVEDTQLRAFNHVVRWATMLAAVAVRIERLKHLSRTQPDAPATIELTHIEIEALRAKRRLIKKRNEVVTEGMPTIRTAVYWIAKMGGYAGKLDENPGATTIGRGLEKLTVLAQGFALGQKLARN